MTHILAFTNYLTSEKRYSNLTVLAYKKDLEQFFSFIHTSNNASLDATQITHNLLRAWIAELKNVGNSAKSINRKISTLKSFYKYLQKQNIVQDAPTSKLISPKIVKRLPSFMQEQQMQNVLEEQAQFSDDFEGKTQRLIIEILYTTGIRRAELANLQTQQVDNINKIIKVIGKGNKERLIPISQNLNLLIQDYITEKQSIKNADNNFLLILKTGKPLYHKYIYLVAKKHLSANSTLQKNSPHVLRHSFATHLLNQGAELNAVKELLGHASLASTQVYTHNSIEKLKASFKKAHPKA